MIREFVREPGVELSLLINAYDDGLSTGALRDMIPGMLGPSDFRKNLSALIDAHSVQQYHLQQLLEYRLPAATAFEQVQTLASAVSAESELKKLPEPAAGWFAQISPPQRRKVLRCIAAFLDYERTRFPRFDYADCSLGNLVFAGAFLQCGRSFNQAVRFMTRLFGIRAHLINVSNGENRSLVALKRNGELLQRESEIVSPQSPSPIDELFLLQQPLTVEQVGWLNGQNLEQRQQWLRARHAPVQLSQQARDALARADVVLFGPGTQFSSLVPSYQSLGTAGALTNSSARARIFVANLKPDHDISGLTVRDLLDNALRALGDVDNQQRCITHVLCPSRSESDTLPFSRDNEPLAHYKGIEIVRADIANPNDGRYHSGYRVLQVSRNLAQTGRAEAPRPSLTVFIDLFERSLALSSTLQEFSELPWSTQFSGVRLTLNQLACRADKTDEFPRGLEVDYLHSQGPCSESAMLKRWLSEPSGSDYLLMLTGDGEYRLRDAFMALQLARSGTFGVIHGSRTQSRRQFHRSLHAAYGENAVMYWLSSVAGYAFAGLFGLLCQAFLSDPLTGFRLYRRDLMPPEFVEAICRRPPQSSIAVTVEALRCNIEIGEFPVTYRTFRGFTSRRWRLRRALNNLIGFLR